MRVFRSRTGSVLVGFVVSQLVRGFVSFVPYLMFFRRGPTR